MTFPSRAVITNMSFWGVIFTIKCLCRVVFESSVSEIIVSIKTNLGFESKKAKSCDIVSELYHSKYYFVFYIKR